MSRKKTVPKKQVGLPRYEFIQRAENGGFPIPNGEHPAFEHGDAVFVVKKRDMMEFMAGIRPMIEWAKNTQYDAAALEALETIYAILEENAFIAPLRELGTPKPD